MKQLILFIITLGTIGSLFAQPTVSKPGQVKWSYWRHMPDDDFGELYAKEEYPDHPDSSRTLFSLRSPINFDNYYASQMRGFIKINTTESVVFNVTGDDETHFYLSTNASPDSLKLVAFVSGYTGSTENSKYPAQTSEPINLVAGQYYYFELRHLDGGGGDHSAVWWKTSFTGLTNWNYISTQYLYDVQDNLTNCPDRGTPCDDADSNTRNDLNDGFCNCIGQPDTTGIPVGERHSILRYKYENIAGGSLNDLILRASNYPEIPSTSQNLDFLGMYSVSQEDSVGTMIEGFLTVPVSGLYEFNLTGNSRARFFLSSNEDPALKTSHQILNINTVGPTQHDDDLSQSMVVVLEKGKYYYYELTHKESTGSEHFGIFWKTPFYQDNHWKRIPAFYLYEYVPEMICVADGTPCDDGNPLTNNDQFSSCDCTGTPCGGPDCDSPLAHYQAYAQCGLTDQLDNSSQSSWLSCTKTVSPNPARGASHWIKYDLGQSYTLFQSQVWNYNEQEQTNQGFNKVVIDYSHDGVSWSQLGDTFTWPLSSGDPSYSGFQGPDFNGTGARYVLITSVDPDNTSGCRGFGKLLFNADNCPSEGIACNDNDPYTVGDIIENCNCRGVNSITNDCETQEINLTNTMLATDNYSAIQKVMSSSIIGRDSLVSFVAGNDIELLSGFEALMGSNFIAQIMDCGAMATRKEINEILKSKTGLYLDITPIENTVDQVIDFLIPYSSVATLEIYSNSGELIKTLLSERIDNPGYYQKLVRTKKLEPGIYTVVISTPKEKRKEKMVVL